MAAPLSIDMTLYRMKAYAGLLKESITEGQQDIGRDIAILVEWIEYARPLLGAVTASAETHNPFARHGLARGYHGMQQGQQMDLNKVTDPGEPPAEDKPAT